MPGTHARLPDTGVLHTLQLRGCLIAEGGVRSLKAVLEEEIIGSLVAQTIGVVGPGPELRVLYGLLGQGGGQSLGQPRGYQQQPAQTDLGVAGICRHNHVQGESLPEESPYFLSDESAEKSVVEK